MCVRLYVFRTVPEGDLEKITKTKVSLPFDPKILVLGSFPKEKLFIWVVPQTSTENSLTTRLDRV